MEIIYIMGCGRSGTTLMDVLIGNSNTIFSCGEINRFFRNRGKVKSNSKNIKSENFWDSVLSDFDDDMDFEQNATLFRIYEYYSAELQILKNKKKEKIYKEANKKLIGSIFKRIDVGSIVDSSKYPYRCLNLVKQGFNVKVIYIKRHPFSVINSFKKRNLLQPSKNFISSLVYYVLCNYLCARVYKKLVKLQVPATMIRYEEICDKPIEEMERLEKELNIDLKEPLSRVQNKEPLNVGLLFEGNRMKEEKRITINKSQIENLSMPYRFITKLVALPFY